MTTHQPPLFGAPSTQWQEIIPPDEAQRFAAYAAEFAELQNRISARQGSGRALHRKQLWAASATFTVLPNLPAFARYGVFAKPASYPVRLRFSNGGAEKAPDARPDIRGLAFAIDGLEGLGARSALGGLAQSQCFVLINHEEFAFAHVDEFVPFALAAAHGPAALLQHFIKRYGWWHGPKELLRILAIVSKPFVGFANETFYSAAPMACGPYAVRVRLQPDPTNGPVQAGARQDWRADIAQRLHQHSLAYTMEVQPFVDETLTPIENPSVHWPTTYVPAARLVLPRQNKSEDSHDAMALAAEQGMFDPWVALADHRPLGNVMRARKGVYHQSQQGRATTHQPLRSS